MALRANRDERGRDGRDRKTTGKGWLAGSDFVEPREPRRQANVTIFGGTGEGKTTFCTRYAPDPIAFISLDRRSDWPAHRAKSDGRKIAYLKVPPPSNPTRLGDEQARKAGQQCVDKVIANFEWAAEQSLKGNIRTVCIDTGTEYSDAVTLSLTGRVDKAKRDYGKSKHMLNQEWMKLFNVARDSDMHFIVLARPQEIWVNDKATGLFKARGPEVMMEGADWGGQIRLKKNAKGKKKKEFELEIVKAGNNIAELGEVYDEELWEDFGGPFVYACMLQYEGSEMEDWQ